MTDKKISELGVITQGDLASGDWVAVVDSSENATKKYNFGDTKTDVTAFFASPDTYTAGTIVGTRAEGFAYKAVDTATASTVANAGGQNFEVLPNQRGEIALEQIGVIVETLGTTGADNTAALAIAAAMTDFTGTFACGPGYVRTNGTFEVPRHASLKCDDTVFDADGSTGTFNKSVVYKLGAAPTAIANLSASPAKGTMTLTFAAAHGLSVGDTALIYNPTDGSYTGYRTSYREGEFCKVAAVTSTTAVELDGPLMADHSHTASNVYKCADLATGTFKGFKTIAPGAGTNGIISGWHVEFAEGVTLIDVRADGSDNTSSTLKQCYRCSGRGLHSRQWGQVASFNTHYGLSIANSQELDLTGIFIGDRHGITTGGFDDFSIPNRAIRVHDFEARNNVPEISAADWHGNTEYSSYRAGICYGGGLNIAGDFNNIENVSVVGGPGCIGILGREIVGWTHKVSGVRIRTDRKDDLRGAALDIGGNNVAIDANGKRGGHLQISNIEIEATQQERSLIRIRNRGYTGAIYTVQVNGFSVISPAGKDVASGIVQVDTFSGDAPHSVEVTGWSLHGTANRRPLSLNGTGDANALVRMSPIYGKVSLTTSTSVARLDQIVTLPITFPKVPSATSSLVGNPVDGVNRIGAAILSVSVDTVRPILFRTDAVDNFGGVVTKEVHYAVTLSEF